MPFEMELDDVPDSQGWKVKIRDNERVEPPHVSILFKRKCWRYGLRAPGFLDSEPPGREVPGPILEAITAQLADLRAAWDAMYPENPIGGSDA